MKYCIICNENIYNTNYSTLENGKYTICEYREKSLYVLRDKHKEVYLIDVNKMFYIISELHKKIDRKIGG